MGGYGGYSSVWIADVKGEHAFAPCVPRRARPRGQSAGQIALLPPQGTDHTRPPQEPSEAYERLLVGLVSLGSFQR